ncbi:hypothetical protein [Methyloversatilis sp.]|uniref:hypothetical protein n=1 Tax=Methyloversatilis sp. TaxID=2569862 RepID=UPI0035B2327F
MKNPIYASLFAACLLATGSSLAAAPAGECEAAAIDKNGKPLAGAAKASFMQKCQREADASNNCESRAVSKDGKPLSGAARTSSIRRCEEENRGR